MDLGLITTWAGGDWLRHACSLPIIGTPAGGKTWLGCAVVHQAARTGFSVLQMRLARLFGKPQVAHGDGCFARQSAALGKRLLLVVDDFAISPMGPVKRSDLLQRLDDRLGTHSTLIARQLPVIAWHTLLNAPTPAGAILCRVVYRSHRIELEGTKSMREADAAAASAAITRDLQAGRRWQAHMP